MINCQESEMTTRAGVACAWWITTLMLVGCGGPVSHPEPVRPVRAIKVGDVQVIQGRRFPGRARAKDEVDLSFQVSGPLISLPIDVGSEVKKGDVLATVDPRDFQAAVDNNQASLERARANLSAMERGARPEEIEQLKAAVEQAEASNQQAIAEHERNAKLVQTGAVSQSDYDISEARVKRTTAEVRQAKEDLNIGLTGARPEDLEAKRAEIRSLEAAVKTAQNQLDFSTLLAPFDGEVAARYVDNFQTVQAGQPIARVLDVSKIEVTVQIPESLISLVPQVKQVVCRFDAFADREFTGMVTKIGSEASLTTRTYPVTVEVVQPEDVRILPGMAATVNHQPDTNGNPTQQDLIIPPSAVFAAESGQQSFVWVVDEASKKVSRTAVKTGKMTPVGLAVPDGLKPGQWVVTSGVNSLREDQQVKLLTEGS
jgi:RND family efflux transporter MFP subunit